MGVEKISSQASFGEKKRDRDRGEGVLQVLLWTEYAQSMMVTDSTLAKIPLSIICSEDDTIH